MLSRFWYWLLHSSEPFVELIIRVCGWSAIIFVFGIFFFILRQGAPFLTNKLHYEVQEARLEKADEMATVELTPVRPAHLAVIQRLLARRMGEGGLEGVKSLWFEASAPGDSPSPPRFLVELAPNADRGTLAARVSASLETAARGMEQFAETIGPGDLALRRVSEGADETDSTSDVERATETVERSAAAVLTIPYLQREEAARRLFRCREEGKVSGVERLSYSIGGPTHRVLLELAPGASITQLAAEIPACLAMRSLVFVELPYENPVEVVVHRMSEVVAEGKVEGLAEIRLETEPSIRVVGDVENDADPEAVAQALLREVPLRQDLSHLAEFAGSEKWIPDSKIRRRFGIKALLVGSISVTLLAMLIAVPFGLGAAIFVSEFCRGKIKETLKIVIELLAAIPSVVWGFIAYMVLSPILIELTGRQPGINLLNGGLILALMSVPVIVSVGEDSLKAVPDSFREAAIALGASRWQLIYKVLLPAAKNGLLAAVLLGVGRAIGETMAVLMATGHAVNMIGPLDVFSDPMGTVTTPVRTLTATIAAELGEAVEGGGHYRALFVIGMVLMLFAFVVNITADLVVRGIRGKQNA